MASHPDVDGGHVSRVVITTIDDGKGFKIDDRIERRRCEGRTAEPVTLRGTDPDAFRYPIDTAAEFEASELTVSAANAVYVHGQSDVTKVGNFESESFGAGQYELELTAPMKLYLRLQGPLSVQFGIDSLTVTPDRSTRIHVGARSFHQRPAATVTTTDDPDDLIEAISTFGSTLKTTSSERSYPTLRGHPPALALGGELSIPRGLGPPDTGVTIEIPPTMRAVFTASTLAYYLGAEIRSADAPRIVTEDGFSHPLSGEDGFERTVERTLKQCFLLDCLVRTAGPRPIPLYERRQLESSLDIDLEDLYGRPSVERLEAYLHPGFEELAPYVPRWKLVSHVTPDAGSVDVLSYLVNDLSIIRSPSKSGPSSGDDSRDATSARTGDVRRSTRSPDRSSPDESTEFVDPGSTDSLEQAWVGRGAPLGASKAMAEAYHNRFDREPRSGDIELVVVCNDDGMFEERDVAEEVYGSREDLPFEVTFYEELSTERLTLVLESDIDYFHYIGHVEDGGFECTDGTLDAATLDGVGVDVFFLNACRSYRQGMELIRSGAIGGVVTLDEIINSGAIRIGKTMARLLNNGFPLRSALNIARDQSIVGSQYLVIGDGNADIAQAGSGVALATDVTRREEGRYTVDVLTYLTSNAGPGAQYKPAIADNDAVYLCPGVTGTFDVDASQLEDFFSLDQFPVFLEGELTWSDEVLLEGSQ